MAREILTHDLDTLIDPDTRATLEAHGFDAARFADLQRQVASGALSPAGNLLRGSIEPPDDAEIAALPAPDSAEGREVRDLGLEALRRGEVAVAVLNGGMATRFGGVVKGVVEAVDGRSFLEWKLLETAKVARATGAPIPFLAMNSFSTDAPTRAFLDEIAARDPHLPEVLTFTQSISLRLNPDGSLFLEDGGKPSLYTPGHGDFPESLRRAGLLDQLRARGVRMVMLSNVDNLGARPDPYVIGMHVRSGRPITNEVAAKAPGDAGGAPAKVNGVTQIVEGFRFPPDFDQDRIRVFNVNSFVFDLDALTADVPLTWFYVEKTVDGRPAVQLERLVNELTASLPTLFLEVPRTGRRGRFFPVKTPADFDTVRPGLREMLAQDILA